MKINTSIQPTLPIRMNGSPGKFTDINIGAGSISLIANENSALNTYCFGLNNDGQLGVEEPENVES